MSAPAPEAARPRVICVTGMHRSGTSLAARAVNLLGVSFGSAASLLLPGPDNPAGYWENRAAKELDDELLARLGGSWDHPPILVPGWEHGPELDDLVVRAEELIARDLVAGPDDLVGLKDPRLALLLPFWTRVAPIVATVVVVRDPLEVAASLEVRNGLGPTDAGSLWLRHLLAALAQGPAPVVVRHRDLVGDLVAAATDLASALGLAPPDAAARASMNDHLDATLVHHVAPAAVPADLDPVLALACTVWNGGDIAPDRLPGALVDAIVQGQLGPPGNRDELLAARAEAVDLRERLRRRLREVRSADGPAGPSGPAGLA